MANVIDTLIVKLGLDNSEFKDKIKEAQEQTDNLTDSTEDFTKSVQKAITFGKVFKITFLSALTALLGIIAKSKSAYDDQIESLRILSRETNQSIEDYQKWAYAIEYAGGNVNAFTSTFEKLSKQVRQAPFTHNSTFLRGLSELGVNVHSANGQIKSMSDLLLGLAGRLSRMSEGKALLIGQRLGLDDDTIRLLHEGKNAVQEYLDKTKQDAVIQKQNLEIYERLRKIRVELSRGWTELSNKIGNYMLPIIEKVSSLILKITTTLKENSSVIKHTTQLIVVLAGVLAGLYLAIAGIVHIVGILKVALWGLGIGALILLWDDFMTYLEGGDSVIGRVIDRIKEWGSALKENLVGAIQFVKDFWHGFVDFFAEKIGWCINLYDRFAGKIGALLDWMGFGSSLIDNVQAIGAAATTNNTSNVSNSTTRYDFPYAKFYMSANNPQEFMTMLPQQTVINAEGNP